MGCLGIAFFATVLGGALIQPSTCALGNADLHLSSRTPYKNIRGDLDLLHGGSSGTEECSPVALWAIVSPGESYPTAQEMERFSALKNLRDRIVENARAGKIELDPRSVALLETWNPSFTTDQAEHLTAEGHREVTAFVRRLQEAFPTLFTEEQANRPLIRTTSNVEARDTASAILVALNNNTDLEEMPAIEQTLENACVSWDEVQRRTEVIVQKYRINSLSKIVADIAQRIGVETLNVDLVRDVYRLCTYETPGIVNARVIVNMGIWCSLFTETEMEAFEYEEDLLSFYNGGPGSELSTAVDSKVLCGMEGEMINNLRQYVQGQRVTIQVASKLTLNAMISSNGLYHYEYMPTTGIKPTRTWRNSHVTPSLGNMITVLHNCGKEGLFLSMHLNERRQFVPRCIYDDRKCTLDFYSRRTNLQPWWCNKDYCDRIVV